MPDTFPESPFHKDPLIKGACLLTGHKRYRDWFLETDHPDYQNRAESYKSLSYTLNRDRNPKSPKVVPGFQSEQMDKQAPEFPSLGRQLLNLAGSAATFVKGGGKITSPEEQARRLAICESNVCGKFKGGRCTICGCHMKGWLAKVKGEDLHCPLPEPLW
jgi:hypothetical protein